MKKPLTMARVAQLVERHPMHRRIAGSIPGPGTYPGCGFNLWLGWTSEFLGNLVDSSSPFHHALLGWVAAEVVTHALARTAPTAPHLVSPHQAAIKAHLKASKLCTMPGPWYHHPPVPARPLPNSSKLCTLTTES